MDKSTGPVHAAFLSGPAIQPRPPAWHPTQLTEQQQRERLKLEVALRAGRLRRVPTVFGGLDEQGRAA
jgi:hypothetical protein